LMDGSVVRIPRGSVTCPPIHVLFVTTGRDGSTAVHPRNLIVAEELTRSTLIESYVNVGGGERFNNVVTEIDLGAGAGMTRFKLLNEGPNGYHLATTKVRQDRDSRFTSFSFFLGGKIARNELSVTLDEEGAECSLNGLYLAEQKQLVDSANAIEHKAPHCSSRIAFKGVLDGKSRAVFSGKVHVHRGAQKTDSNQLNQNLLLSDEATVDTKPLLEIFADDVKCTHGATVGRPPREQIFYLQSRGLSEAMARAVLTYGFADEVVREVDIEPLRKRLDKVVFDRYSPR